MRACVKKNELTPISFSKCFPVETEDYFYQVVRYVERNALRANLVERAESWRWSSLRRVRARRPGVPHPLDAAFCDAPPIGCNLSTNRKRKPKWPRCVAASIAVGPSAILTGSRRRPSDWGWNRRFGPMEGRRNNHRLVTITCVIRILQIWWLSPSPSGACLAISPFLGLTPPGYELSPLRGWQSSRCGHSVTLAQPNSSGTRHGTGWPLWPLLWPPSRLPSRLW